MCGAKQTAKKRDGNKCSAKPIRSAEMTNFGKFSFWRIIRERLIDRREDVRCWRIVSRRRETLAKIDLAHFGGLVVGVPWKRPSVFEAQIIPFILNIVSIIDRLNLNLPIFYFSSHRDVA